MPMFDFRCECGHAFEYLQMGADDQPRCPRCDSTGVSRERFSAFHVGTAASRASALPPPCGQAACGAGTCAMTGQPI